MENADVRTRYPVGGFLLTRLMYACSTRKGDVNDNHMFYTFYNSPRVYRKSNILLLLSPVPDKFTK